MNEFDAMRLLAEANPVREQDLTPLVLPDRFARRMPRRLGLAVAIAAVMAAALVGVVAFNGPGRGQTVGDGSKSAVRPIGPTGPVGPTGTTGPTGILGATGSVRPTGSVGPTGASAPLGTSASMVYNHRGTTLTSVDVTATEPDNGGIEVEVFHRAAGDSTGASVVYRRSVSAGEMSSGTWSATLYPSDWNGGCQSGVYWIDVRFDLYPKFNADTRSDARFTCRGN